MSFFIFSHYTDFNGMLDKDFNAQIDEFYLEIVNALVRKIKRTSQLEGENCFGEKRRILRNSGPSRMSGRWDAVFKAAGHLS